jgi:peptide/nickel transport system permease protein
MPFNNSSKKAAAQAGHTSMKSRSSRTSAGMMLLCLALVAFSVLSPATCMAGPATARTLVIASVPIADAGKNISATANHTVRFDGSLSVPSDGATITDYNWTFSYYGVSYELEGAFPEFNFNRTEVTGFAVEVTLNVTDSHGLSATDNVWVFVRYAPPSFLEKYWFELVMGAAIVIIVGYYAIIAISRLVRREPVVTDAGKEKFSLTAAKGRKITWQLLKNPMGLVGTLVLSFFVLMAIFGPSIAPYSVDLIDLPNAMNLPSPNHWLGTDNFGRDIFSELLYGARTSIIVGIVSAIIASFLGAAVGLYSGYVGGWKDEVVMRLNDVVLSIPWLVLMIIVAAFIGTIDLTGIILIIGLTGWSTTARMVRAQVLSVKERQYVERARSIGASEMAIIRRHIFPNTFPLIFANTILTVAVSILSEATLSFLGLRPSGVVTWGTMLSYANEYDAFSNGLEWWTLAPGLCIVGVVLGFTLLGYALDDILNPKLRHR